jgi:hypothetical protein
MQGQRRRRRLGTPPGPPALAVGTEDIRPEAENSEGHLVWESEGSYGREAHAAAQGGQPPQVRVSCQHGSRVGESPRKLPGNGSQPKPIGAKAQSAKTPIFVGAMCGALLQVGAKNALITQRSLVQIQPPQPGPDGPRLSSRAHVRHARHGPQLGPRRRCGARTSPGRIGTISARFAPSLGWRVSGQRRSRPRTPASAPGTGRLGEAKVSAGTAIAR